jgi:hypothetical protein
LSARSENVGDSFSIFLYLFLCFFAPELFTGGEEGKVEIAEELELSLEAKTGSILPHVRVL